MNNYLNCLDSRLFFFSGFSFFYCTKIVHPRIICTFECQILWSLQSKTVYKNYYYLSWIWTQKPQQNISKWYPTIYKRNYKPWPSRCFLGTQDWLSIKKSINVTNHINKLKMKNFMIILRGVQKSFDKCNFYHDQNSQKIRNTGELLQLDKEDLWTKTL